MPTKEELYFQLEELKEKLTYRQFKFYYINSIENFIFHLDSFQNIRIQEQMANKLEDYLKQASSKVEEQGTPLDKIIKLSPAFHDIMYVYRLELGFIKKTDLFLILLLASIFFLLLAFVLTKFQSFLICFSVFVIYSIWSYLKLKARKVY